MCAGHAAENSVLPCLIDSSVNLVNNCSLCVGKTRVLKHSKLVLLTRQCGNTSLGPSANFETVTLRCIITHLVHSEYCIAPNLSAFLFNV